MRLGDFLPTWPERFAPLNHDDVPDLRQILGLRSVLQRRLFALEGAKNVTRTMTSELERLGSDP